MVYVKAVVHFFTDLFQVKVFLKNIMKINGKKRETHLKLTLKLVTILELLFSQKKNMSILDVGTGNGSMITGLEQKGFTNIEGCEPNKSSYLEAKKRINYKVWRL